MKTPTDACRLVPACLLLFCWLLFPCLASAAAEPLPAYQTLRIALPAYLADSELMNRLAWDFEEETGIRISFTPGLPRELFSLAESCRVDAFLCDYPELESSFVQAGRSRSWTGVYYTNFILVGPKGNPQKVTTNSVPEALADIANRGVLFVSNRDGTGARMAELYIWRLLRRNDVTMENWYHKARPAVDDLLPTAANLGAYTLVDGWNWLRYQLSFPAGECPLEEILSKSFHLENQYNYLVVSPTTCPRTNQSSAMRFGAWLSSLKVQRRIAEFRYQGKAVFYPMDARISILH